MPSDTTETFSLKSRVYVGCNIQFNFRHIFVDVNHCMSECLFQYVTDPYLWLFCSHTPGVEYIASSTDIDLDISAFLLMWNLTVTRIISFRLVFDDCHDIHVSIWYMYQDSIIRFDHRAQAHIAWPFHTPCVSLTYTCLPQHHSSRYIGECSCKARPSPKPTAPNNARILVASIPNCCDAISKANE
jgi:hypothetical protein